MNHDFIITLKVLNSHFSSLSLSIANYFEYTKKKIKFFYYSGVQNKTFYLEGVPTINDETFFNVFHLDRRLEIHQQRQVRTEISYLIFSVIQNLVKTTILLNSFTSEMEGFLTHMLVIVETNKETVGGDMQN